MFFCLKGEHFDGHDFIDDVLKKGARYVVVDNEAYAARPGCIKVDDVLKALQALAHEYRKEFSIPVIAIGGSNGKTTTKELTRVILETIYKVHSTKTNLNNHIGVPLTLLAMPKDTTIAVIEIGANHAHEHEQLLEILEPTHVIVTNNGKDHLEGFGSIEGVQAANGEIYTYAKEHDLEVFVPSYESDLVSSAEGLKKILYGYDENIKYSFSSMSNILAAVKIGDTILQSNLFGDFNEKNIMTAVAIGLHFDCDLTDISKAVQQYQPELLRSQIKELNGTRYIVDCYNANPSSMTAALENFKKYAHKPNAVILGDMLEMGEHAAVEHENILRLLQQYNFDLNILIGTNFGQLQPEYKDNVRFHFFENVSLAKRFLADVNLQGFDVLLKGSNSIKIKEILE